MSDKSRVQHIVQCYTCTKILLRAKSKILNKARFIEEYQLHNKVTQFDHNTGIYEMTQYIQCLVCEDKEEEELLSNECYQEY